VEFRDGVRKRPGMYVGGTDGAGVMNMILEVLGNAIDQHLLGRCKRIAIAFDDDRMVTVEDDGPGIEVKGTKVLPPIEKLLTENLGRPSVDGHQPHVHVGLGGVGLAAVNALCETFELTTIHGGVEASIAFERGVIVRPLTTKNVEAPSGTRVRFRADPEIFANAEPHWLGLNQRIDDLSFVAPGLALSWRFSRAKTGGMPARIALLDHGLMPVAHHRGRHRIEDAPIDVDVALTWKPLASRQSAVVHSFVNLERTREGGQHVRGLQTGVCRWFGGASWDFVSNGLYAGVSVILPDVIFGNPTRDRLDTPRACGAVEEATIAALDAWASAYPDSAREMRRRVADA
jgi:DNA gyrase subunit B